MGIVLKQSFWNSILISTGFLLGAVNVLFLFTRFVDESFFGLITFLLSTANILLPLLAFGMSFTIIKFFSAFEDSNEQDRFLWMSLWVPILVLIPLSLFFIFCYEQIASWISKENALIEGYTWYIWILGFAMAYFEIFFAWSKVQLKSVFGTFLKEVFARLGTFFGLILLVLGHMDDQSLVVWVVWVYILRFILMLIYALNLYQPRFDLRLPKRYREVLAYSVYIILAGSAGTILLEIDKFMIPQLEALKNVAFYSVGVYMASTIAIPSRAMQQIVAPLTAEFINKSKWEELKSLFYKTTRNLTLIGGLAVLLIFLNLDNIYAVIGKEEYRVGYTVVIIIGVSELFKLSMGNTNSILLNSKYYRWYFLISLAMALSVVVLNAYLIEIYGIIGAAWATMSVVIGFGMFKMALVYAYLKVDIFTWALLKNILIGALCYWVFDGLDLGMDSPIFNILISSFIIAVSYLVLVYVFRVSPDVNSWLKSKLS